MSFSDLFKKAKSFGNTAVRRGVQARDTFERGIGIAHNTAQRGVTTYRNTKAKYTRNVNLIKAKLAE